MHSKEHIQNIADTLLPSFLPKDQEATELVFHFTIKPNKSYKVWYQKKNSTWEFIKYEEDER